MFLGRRSEFDDRVVGTGCIPFSFHTTDTDTTAYVYSFHRIAWKTLSGRVHVINRKGEIV
jgi:hypothetical protein